jgi:hypothetical protein
MPQYRDPVKFINTDDADELRDAINWRDREITRLRADLVAAGGRGEEGRRK